MLTLADREFDRFWSKVTQSADGCWLWDGSMRRDGYGQISFGGRLDRHVYLAHRLAYELIVGPVPRELVIDHLCRNRACVNPTHLEPVTTRENLLRGEGWSGRHARKTHCPAGHPLKGDNLSSYHLKRGQRKCLACHAARQRVYKAKLRAERLGSNVVQMRSRSVADSGAGA